MRHRPGHYWSPTTRYGSTNQERGLGSMNHDSSANLGLRTHYIPDSVHSGDLPSSTICLYARRSFAGIGPGFEIVSNCRSDASNGSSTVFRKEGQYARPCSAFYELRNHGEVGDCSESLPQPQSKADGDQCHWYRHRGTPSLRFETLAGCCMRLCTRLQHMLMSCPGYCRS